MLILNESIKTSILKHALTEQTYNRECCGVLYRAENSVKYASCRNIASSSTEFVLHPLDYARIEDAGDILGIVHSHINDSPEPSTFDREEAEKSGLPWHIVSLPDKTFYSFKPDSHHAPLVGRQFSRGYLDCFALCRDYYNYELGIALKDVARTDEDWWDIGESLLLDHFKDFGFGQVYDLKKNDILLMNIESDVPNHLAVYTGDEKILHHLGNRLSKTDPYGGYWQKHTFAIIRHNALV